MQLIIHLALLKLVSVDIYMSLILKYLIKIQDTSLHLKFTYKLNERTEDLAKELENTIK